MTTSGLNQQVRVLVTHRRCERNSYATNSVNDFFERTEVNIDVVINQDAEVVKDRDDQWIRIIAIESTIDTTLSLLAVDTHPEVARKGQDSSRVGLWVKSQDHESVGALAQTIAITEG